MSELFLAPSVVLPMVAGASAWLVSWALGGITSLTLAGLIGILLGAGWMATRMIFQLDAITERTMRFAEEKIRQEEERRLDQLQVKLSQLPGRKALDYLTILRENRKEFDEITRQPAMKARSLQVTGQFHQLFLAALEQLERSYKLSELSGRLQSEERREMIMRNEETLADIDATVDSMSAAVEHFRRLSLRAQNSDLSELRDELDESLKVARQTEERMREFERDTGYQRHLKE